MYQPLRPSQSDFVAIRHLRYHVRTWGQPAPAVAPRPPLVLLHGWMDVAASWQFVVDALTADRFIMAPDWRGFGLTEAAAPVDNYWFPDYLADLDLLLDHYAGEQPVDLVGHSMGGNVAMMYAGVRPARIRRLVNLEGFGMPATRPDQAPARYAQWIDQLKSLHTGTLALRGYDSVDGVARRLMKTNRRLPQDKADWLARHWAREQPEPGGRSEWQILGDAAHKLRSANLWQLEEALALYRAITAPTLSVEASDDSLRQWHDGRYRLEEYHERVRQVADCRIARVEDAGHMLHHDQPAQVARLIDDFLR